MQNVLFFTQLSFILTTDDIQDGIQFFQASPRIWKY